MKRWIHPSIDFEQDNKQAILTPMLMWNDNNSDVEISEDTKQPDYTNLRDCNLE